jgi:hypothetical protein
MNESEGFALYTHIKSSMNAPLYNVAHIVGKHCVNICVNAHLQGVMNECTAVSDIVQYEGT